MDLSHLVQSISVGIIIGVGILLVAVIASFVESDLLDHLYDEDKHKDDK